jgi:hypothetical protein
VRAEMAGQCFRILAVCVGTADTFTVQIQAISCILMVVRPHCRVLTTSTYNASAPPSRLTWTNDASGGAQQTSARRWRAPRRRRRDSLYQPSAGTHPGRGDDLSASACERCKRWRCGDAAGGDAARRLGDSASAGASALNNESSSGAGMEMGNGNGNRMGCARVSRVLLQQGRARLVVVTVIVRRVGRVHQRRKKRRKTLTRIGG